MKEYIVLNQVCHSYQGANGQMMPALNDVSLTIHQGEFVAIIGTNGSGKSTLAKNLNALLLPTSGECRVQGIPTHDEERLWDIRQNVGMVFQNPDNQIVAAIVEEDVAFGPENLGIASADIAVRVNEALAAVEMEDYRNHAPHLLSGGQKQRVAIAGILAMRPRCLVLDEPTAMLDPRGRREVLATVRRLNAEQGITVVYITHFMEEAACAHRVVAMNKGEIIMQGSPRDIFSQAEMLTDMGLDIPLAADVAQRLRKKGIALPDGIVSNEELAVALCQLS